MDDIGQIKTGLDAILGYISISGILKIGVVGILFAIVKKYVLTPLEKWPELFCRLAKVEAKDDTNVLYREISQKERDDIKETQKKTGYKIDNLSEDFKEFKYTISEHLQVKPQKRTKILIFDDNTTSAEIIKEKLSTIDSAFVFITTNDIAEARAALKHIRIGYVFADLNHGEKGREGLELYKDCSMFGKHVKYILYSADTKPKGYDGLFFNKMGVTPDFLSKYF